MRRASLVKIFFRVFIVIPLTVLIGLLAGEGRALSDNPSSFPKKVADGLEAEHIPWLESLADRWRNEYLLIHISGHLFMEDDSESSQEDDGGHDSNGPSGSEDELPPSFSAGTGETPCAGYCRVAEQYLKAGFFPEALARYRRAIEVRGPGRPDNLCPEIGMLKVYLAMGRVPEAKSTRERIAEWMDAKEDPFLILADGILACYSKDYALASTMFQMGSYWWHLCPNLEAIVGYSRLRNHQYAEAVTAFEAAENSRFEPVSRFATLGVADCLLGLGRRMKAGGRYGSLATALSPMGLLALAEFRLQGGYSESAELALTTLQESQSADYWKGIALAYQIALKGDENRWRECLGMLDNLGNLVLSGPWKEYFEQQTEKILKEVFFQAFEERAYKEVLFLAEEWKDRVPLLPQAVQLVIAEAYRNLGLCVTALEMLRELPLEPGSLLQAGKTAWACEQYALAQEMLEELSQSGLSLPGGEARLLLALTLFNLGRTQEAESYLKVSREAVDPEVLIAVAKMELSLDMMEMARRDFHTVMAEPGLASDLRYDVLGNLASLYYRMGRFSQAVAFFQMREEVSPSGQGPKLEPMEILSLLKIDQHQQALEELESKRGEAEAEDFLKEILSTEEAINTLHRSGYVF